MGIIGLLCLLVAFGMALWSFCCRKRNVLQLRPGMDNPQVAILIPARDESMVIEGILKSMARQTYALNMNDIYVVIEDVQDPTAKICESYGVSVILRKDSKKQRKGYALDEAMRDILKNRRYDVYFIFDADNVTEKDFVAKMLRHYADGYQMAIGYRNIKNQNLSVLEVVSSLTFAMINEIGNQRRMQERGNMIFSGTGFYVDGRLVDEWQGWPFHSLTEDYEASCYAILNGIATYYDEAAVFYDEQPTKYSQTVAQRVRWIRGYFDVRKKYIPLMRKIKASSCNNYGSLIRTRVGVKPVILLIFGMTLVSIDIMGWLVARGEVWSAIWVVIGYLLVVYIGLEILTIIVIRSDKMKLERWIWWKVILLNPFYLMTYVPCALKALLKKDVVWTKIQHGKS